MSNIYSLGEQFKATIGKKIRLISYTKCLALMQATCDRIVMSFDNYVQFMKVTGNAYTSFTVGVYYEGKLVYYRNKGDNVEPPTMRSLRKNQVYPLDFYYDGRPVDDHPFRSSVGKGGQYGPTLGPWRIRREKPKTRAEWSLLIILPVEYAPVRDTIIQTMRLLRDNLPALVESEVMFVKGR